MKFWSYSEAERAERQRRVHAAIAQVTAKHMSDAKWRKLFTALEPLRIRTLRCKFVRDDRVFEVYGSPEILEHQFGENGGCSYSVFREIEWLEIPAEYSAGVADHLACIADFRSLKQSAGYV